MGDTRTTNPNDRRATWVLALTSVASLMVALDALVVSTALSTIRLELHASLADLEWTVNAYVLSFAVLLMTGAALGDRFGRKRLFIAGMGLFVAGSAACALARSIGWLIAARAVQGAGAALMMPLGLALLSAAFPPEQRPRALGIFGAITGLGIVLGPLVGGAAVQGLSWPWIFWINVPIGLGTIAYSRQQISESFGPDTALDVPGLALVTVGAFGIVWALVLSSSQAVPTTTVAQVGARTPAANVLRPGDQVVSVDGVRGSESAIRNQIDTHRCAGAQVNGCRSATPATVVIRRDGQLVTLQIHPRYDATVHRPLLGITFGGKPANAVQAASITVNQLASVTGQTVSTVARIFEPQERKQLHSIVYGYTATQESFATSTTQALWVLALISLSLAIINLFPFLPLDGGHVFWAVAEKLRGKRIPFEVMERAGVVGFVLILFIFVIGLTNDISTLSGPGIGLR